MSTFWCMVTCCWNMFRALMTIWWELLHTFLRDDLVPVRACNHRCFEVRCKVCLAVLQNDGHFLRKGFKIYTSLQLLQLLHLGQVAGDNWRVAVGYVNTLHRTKLCSIRFHNISHLIQYCAWQFCIRNVTEDTHNDRLSRAAEDLFGRRRTGNSRRVSALWSRHSGMGWCRGEADPGRMRTDNTRRVRVQWPQHPATARGVLLTHVQRTLLCPPEANTSSSK